MPSELAALINRHIEQDGIAPSAIPSLYLFRSTVPDAHIHAFYEQSVCFVAQGTKSVMLDNQTYTYSTNEFLLVSVALPMVSRVEQATSECPHLAFHINLDLRVLSELLLALNLEFAAPKNERALSVAQVDPLLQSTLLRLIQLLDTPQHIPVLAPLLLREIHYLLLMGSEGWRIRDLTLATGQTNRISRVIQRLRQDYHQPLQMEQLAQENGMSVSSLHHVFKAITGHTPLQYQKQVRLQEARRLMLAEDFDAASASFQVGYESPSQFSREYRRMFGRPPIQDIQHLRESQFS